LQIGSVVILIVGIVFLATFALVASELEKKASSDNSDLNDSIPDGLKEKDAKSIGLLIYIELLYTQNSTRYLSRNETE
jgi:hypothetical protein